MLKKTYTITLSCRLLLKKLLIHEPIFINLKFTVWFRKYLWFTISVISFKQILCEIYAKNSEKQAKHAVLSCFAHFHTNSSWSVNLIVKNFQYATLSGKYLSFDVAHVDFERKFPEIYVKNTEKQAKHAVLPCFASFLANSYWSTNTIIKII